MVKWSNLLFQIPDPNTTVLINLPSGQLLVQREFTYGDIAILIAASVLLIAVLIFGVVLWVKEWLK